MFSILKGDYQEELRQVDEVVFMQLRNKLLDLRRCYVSLVIDIIVIDIGMAMPIIFSHLHYIPTQLLLEGLYSMYIADVHFSNVGVYKVESYTSDTGDTITTLADWNSDSLMLLSFDTMTINHLISNDALYFAHYQVYILSFQIIVQDAVEKNISKLRKPKTVDVNTLYSM